MLKLTHLNIGNFELACKQFKAISNELSYKALHEKLVKFYLYSQLSSMINPPVFVTHNTAAMIYGGKMRNHPLCL
ncbi:hypothetical protein PNK_0624 [Candidatus Protochlamydia naegleriophila]|uniref:Uncharacterized protein n=1 Tax=Candidatus Protochlamydia naegleriophila TaxID=389348 RepID=A0A0U5K2C1_9BACT|nr:hypothetical protein PNK_0624 [Candidatus Protochlamydia naegleriophila]